MATIIVTICIVLSAILALLSITGAYFKKNISLLSILSMCFLVIAFITEFSLELIPRINKSDFSAISDIFPSLLLPVILISGGIMLINVLAVVKAKSVQ